MATQKADDIARSLRVRIASPEWQALRRLPNERDLARDYGVARNTLRKAIASLEADGLVSRAVGRGTLIRERVPANSGGLSDIVSKLNDISPFDMMNMRLIIEPEAAASAAIHASDTEIDALCAVHAAAVPASHMLSFERLDMAFHELIFAATRNELLKNLNEILVILRSKPSVTTIRRSTFSEARRIECNDQHAAILAALKARDPNAAAEAMKLHLSVRSRNIFGGDVSVQGMTH